MAGVRLPITFDPASKLCAASMSRGSVFQALQKLSGDWSAPDYARFLTEDILTELLSAFEMMEPLVRARLLLAAASLPADAQDAMRDQLQV